MAIKTYKSMTNGTRGMSTIVNDEITKTVPEKSLTVTLKKKGGRNNQGKITLRHRGGGAKIKLAFVPPNPNEFDTAYRTCRFFALCGTKSISQFPQKSYPANSSLNTSPYDGL